MSLSSLGARFAEHSVYLVQQDIFGLVTSSRLRMHDSQTTALFASMRIAVQALCARVRLVATSSEAAPTHLAR